MKTRSRELTLWLAALVCLTLAPGTKAGDETDTPEAPTSQKDRSDTQSGEHRKHAHSSDAACPDAMRAEGAPAKCDKASSILGMAVRNQKDEHLGHIKDLVIDWKTEQVSYAVISTGSKTLLGMGGKLLAVPLTALTASPDRDHLVLNADKEKVAAATGFDADNWPSVSSPSWGAEPFWQTGTEKPAISSPSTKESDTEAQSNMSPETDPEAAPDMEQESHSHSESESDSDMEQEHEAEPDLESSPDTNAGAR